ncbi:MAG: dihydroorotase [Spirochaetaceae bacterium]|nr:dihydroorotase [Spirochaetaceae bacterium]
MVDPHVHLRDWEDRNKDTIEHGIKVAIDCNFTEVFDMPNTKPPLTNRDVILDRLADAGEALINLHKSNFNYRVYAGLTKDKEQIKEVVETYFELFPMVVGLKMFAGHSTGNMGIVDIEDQEKVFKTLVEYNYDGVLAIHCEKESLMDPSKFDKNDLSTQSVARPAIAEIESVSDMINLAKKTSFKGTLDIVHISTKDALELVKKTKSEINTFRICCGATAHHALLNQSAANDKSYAKMNPPLRTEEDRIAIFNGLLDGSIDWIESDQAPHTIEDKRMGAGGIPGFSGSLLLIEALIKAGASKNRIISLVGKRVYEVFNLDSSDISFSVGNIRLLRQKSLLASKEYPYDAFISLR